MTPSAVVLRRNIEALLASSETTLAEMCAAAGVERRRLYPFTSGLPKSMTLRTLDLVARVFDVEPWSLLSPDGARGEYAGEDSTAAFKAFVLGLPQATQRELPRALIAAALDDEKTHSLRTLDRVAVASCAKPHNIIKG